MKIHIVNKQKLLPIKAAAWRSIVQEIALLQKETFEEVTLHFVDKKTISALHETFFDDPTPTDCISFPLDGPSEPYRILGEVFVCPEVAKEYTALKGGSFQREVVLYALHGLLHLFGYDDMTPNDKRRMRRAEKKHLTHLDTKGLIPL